MITIMRTSILLSINGPRTIASYRPLVRGLVKTKTVVGNADWSSTEYNANNAWNVNGGSGVVNNNNNNNNKNNSNIVRPVCALNGEEKVSWIEAYRDCLRGKLSSKECCKYRIGGEEDVLRLALEAHNFTYKPSKSICFCVTRPKLREVFAADFRDRIVHHWICIRLEPLFEQRFVSQGDLSFNCRKGYGVLRAVETAKSHMMEVSANQTRPAYVMKLDLSGFFMSIDKEILWQMLSDFIEQNYFGNDKEILTYLAKTTVMHTPQTLCEKRGDAKLFDRLPANKTLFKAKATIGMPIGNLTSQLFANFYMNEFDNWLNGIMREMGGRYIRFVDDILMIGNDRKKMVKIIPIIRSRITKTLHLKMNDNKFYLQSIGHGVMFLGNVVRPDRIYSNNTLLNHISAKLQETDRYCQTIYQNKNILDSEAYELYKYFRSLNSFMGFMVHNNTFAIRRGYLRKCPYLWKIAYYKKRCDCFAIKRRYKIQTTIKFKRYENRTHYRNRNWEKVRPAFVRSSLLYRWQERAWREFIEKRNLTSRNTDKRRADKCLCP